MNEPVELMPKVLIVAHEDYIDWAKDERYTENWLDALKQKGGELSMVSIEEVNRPNSPYKLESKPSLSVFGGTPFQVYVYNASEEQYLLPKQDLADSLVKSQLLIYKTALVYLGAKSIQLAESTEEIQTESRDLEVKGAGSTPLNSVGGRASHKSTSKIGFSVRSVVRYENIGNVAKSESEILRYFRKNGLDRDACLIGFLEELKKNSLVGSRQSVSYEATREANGTIEMLGDLSASIGTVKINLDAKAVGLSTRVEKYCCSLEVQF